MLGRLHRYNMYQPALEYDLRHVGATQKTAYENSFSSVLGEGVRSFAFWKGRVALYAILKALEIGPGDDVILPGYTCVVVPNAVRLAGARPVYVDIPEGSFNLLPAAVERALTMQTKAILIQHTYGIPDPVDGFLEIAHSRGLKVIEDCAHALGSEYADRHVGASGDAAFFSSQWSKPYTTGLGGLAVTQDAELAHKIEKIQRSFHLPPVRTRFSLSLQYKIFQIFFTPKLYWFAQSILHKFGRLGLFVGSSRDSELEGVLPADHEWLMPQDRQEAGLRKLRQLEANIRFRRELGQYYDRRLEEAGWKRVHRKSGTTLLRYPLRVNNKRELLHKAGQENVELGSWFETPLHPTPLEKHPIFGYQPGQCPNAERAAKQVVNLPMHEKITEGEAERILQFFIQHAERSQP
jgi:perosamine synthetase